MVTDYEGSHHALVIGYAVLWLAGGYFSGRVVGRLADYSLSTDLVVTVAYHAGVGGIVDVA